MAEEIKRTYVVPLRRGYFNTPRYKRTNKAVTVLKNFLVKHMKSENIKLGPHLNEFIWKDGIKNPPAKVKIDVTKDKEGMVRAELSGKKYVDFKMQEKVDKNQSFKEKLQNKVKDAKGDKTESVEDKVEDAPKTTETKKEVKKEVKPATKAPAKKETTKVEEKQAEEKVVEKAETKEE